MNRRSIVPLILLSVSLAFPQEVIEREFDTAPGKRLDVDNKSGGSIEITGWENERIKVVVTVEGYDCDDVDVEFDERRSGLSIWTHRGKWFDHDCDLSFDILLPNVFDLDVETSGGMIRIDNVEGEIEGGTMGGGLNLTRIKGEVSMTTMGGNISLTNSEVDGQVKTMGGNLLIRDVAGNVKGSTMGGNVTYKSVSQREGETVNLSTMGGNMDIDSKGGKVEAKTWGGNIRATGDEVHVSTMGGDVDVDEAPTGADIHTMGGDIQVVSARKYVKAKTMGGDIDVDAIDGWIRASTMGGDVTVTMTGDPEEGKRDVELSSMGGDISLTVPSRLSMDFQIEVAYTKNARRQYRIVSDFPIELEETDEWKRSAGFGSPRKYIYGTGKVARGKNRIEIKTVNGDIYIKKGGNYTGEGGGNR